MIYILKAGFFLYVLFSLIMEGPASPVIVLGWLSLLASTIFKEKYALTPWVLLGELVAILVLASYSSVFLSFLALAVLDLIRVGSYYVIPLLFLCGPFFFRSPELSDLWFLQFVCLVLGCSIKRSEVQLLQLTSSYDDERHRRYRLETVKASLLRSTEEQAHLAEIQERNRIGRQIHDHLGHALVGVFIQLQAVDKLLMVDRTKAEALLNQCIRRLSASIDLLRDTVHNLQAGEKLGLDYIQQIIDDFTFCPVEFASTGNWQEVSPSYLELLASNMKEALTNVARYSQATMVVVQIDITCAYIRLYIKDNGLGCANYREGMGLSGMRERVNNVSGNLSISCHDGFMIVCFLPLQGGQSDESASSR